MKKSYLFALARVSLASTLLAGVTATSHAAVLTGVGFYLSDAAGNAQPAGVWNTVGGDGNWNSYFRRGPVWFNSGDGASTSLNIDMSAPGEYFFEVFQDSFANHTSSYYTTTFYFDGANQPQIALVNRVSSGANPTIPTANTLLGMTSFSGVANPFSLTYQNVTVTNHNSYQLAGTDFVSPFAIAPSGSGDLYGAMTFAVVPEPGTFALVGLGMAFAARRKRARR
ncbi:MAG: PEP-CTERM sorting domain-containing protein [Fimbriimonadaceae bacterium]|nr:PEP-CTERM sorting domain-containing protein [Fimbriimonadaceae bacterium]